ncbi:ABC transporter substrate-binding protein [Rubrobacter indicoceani]|uniref:ABC transporter substrate-binding protein n=1 Tax=Rubrobacter indicoceani TaxID=2051957 RepID=UPI000E5B45FE|nr:ABC transporter substrate-binding protein [Rubrobacter indicoceani]
MSKRFLPVGLLVLLVAVACGAGGSETPEQASSGSCDTENPPLYKVDTLTVATDSPAYPPWFEGSPENYSGFEGDVANQIANRMTLPVTWVEEPFNTSYAPGAKDWDMALNQITITEERERDVSFSRGYFDNAQGILAREGSPAVGARSLSDLEGVRLGAQVGTTSLTFVDREISPEREVSVYETSEEARAALESGRIDAFVTDLATTVYLRDFEVEDSVVVGQYPANEQFGIVFQRDNELVGCVNQILAEMEEDGTLENLRNEYLQRYLDVPELEG